MKNENFDKTDKMLRAYFTREQSEFTYKEPEKKPIHLRYTSMIAAALVLVMCIGFFAYSALQPKNDFIISVSAADSSNNGENTSDESGGRVGIISLCGNNITDVTAQSMNGNGEFVWLINEDLDKHEIHSDIEVNAKPENKPAYNISVGYINTHKTNDTIELVIHFDDGTSATRYVDVTFSDGTSTDAEMKLEIRE